MARLRLEIPPPWDEIDAKARKGLALLFGEAQADTQARYEEQRRLIAETNALMEEREAEADAAFERMWETPEDYRERRIRALAKFRFREEQERVQSRGHTTYEWNAVRQDHFEDKARFEIELAEKTFEDVGRALAAFPDTRVRGEVRPAPSVAILPPRDKLDEAKRWLTHPSPFDKSGMVAELQQVHDTVLVKAYDIWWGTYSRGIQSAPSNRKIDGIQQGVREKDATAAAEAATQAVFDYLRKDTHGA